MAVRNRPYNMPREAIKLQATLNTVYDAGVKAYYDLISEELASRPALHISITNVCNLNCTYCYDKRSQPPHQRVAYMTTDLAKEIFKVYSNPAYVFVLGGEPFLNPDALITILDTRASRVAISTNGQVRDQRSSSILSAFEKRVAEGFGTLLQISCDLGGVSFERGLQHPRATEKTLRSFQETCSNRIKIKYTVTEDDVPSIYQIARWYWDRNLPVQFDYVDGGFDDGISINLSDENRSTIFHLTLESLHFAFSQWLTAPDAAFPILRAKILVNQIFPVTLWQIKNQVPIWSSCNTLGFSLYVNSEGALYPCHRWKRGRQAYGNLGEDVTEKILHFHRDVSPTIREHCSGCIWRGCCGCICPAVACNYGESSLIGRCKFLGALTDAVWAFLLDEMVLSHPHLDSFLSAVCKHSPSFTENTIDVNT